MWNISKLSALLVSIMSLMVVSASAAEQTTNSTTTEDGPLPGSAQNNSSSGGGNDLPSPEPVIDWQKHVTDNQRLETLGFDLMGDQIDHNNGSVSFEHTDVSIPGNSSLSVAIKRRLTRGILYDESQASEFGDWEIVVPRITAVTHEATNFRTGNRCSGGIQFQPITMNLKVQAGQSGSPTTNVLGHQYSQGLQLSTVEYGSEQILRSGLTGSLGPHSASDKYVTRSNFKFSCLSNITGGGEGFIGTSPDGHIYHFDRFYERHTQDEILSNYVDADAKRYSSIVAATQVTDVHGNWVKYEYDSDNRLTKIHSNEGREVTLSYTGANSPVSSITANGRTWSYEYTNRPQIYAYTEWGQQSQSGQNFYSLTDVTLPDNRTWLIEALNYDKPTELDGCTPYQNLTPLGDFDVFFKHPSGAWGKFKFNPVRRRVGHKILETKQVYGATSHVAPVELVNGTGVTIACLRIDSINRDIPSDGDPGGQPVNDPAPGDDQNPDDISAYSMRPANVLMYRHMMALVKKEISNPDDINFPTSTWDISYEQVPLVHYTNLSAIPTTPIDERNNWTKVEEPDASEVTQFYHWDAETYGGELKRKEYRLTPGASSLLRAEDYTYINQSVSVGIPEFNSIYPPAIQREPIYQTGSIISQDSDTYTQETSYNTDILSAGYSFGNPTEMRSWSNYSISNESKKRITEITYEHNTAEWILGLPKTMTRNGRLLKTYNYSNEGQVEEVYPYEQSLASAIYDYNLDGTVLSVTVPVTASESRVTTADNWKRGKPQLVTLNDSSTIGRSIDDNGWTMSQTDQSGNSTAYQRDSMGRLKRITPHTPSSGYKLVDTIITYNFAGGGAVQTIKKGPRHDIIEYDSLFRPVLEQVYNLSNQERTYTNTVYDGLGRVTFKSFPSSSATTLDGTTTLYDGLGRIKESQETVIPYAKTRYLYYANHRSYVIDPEGKATQTYRYGYDGPGQGDTYLIRQPEGIDTWTFRNVHGEVTRVRQRGGNPDGGLVDKNQYYSYDSNRRVCRHATLEGGTTVYKYNSAGELTDYQKGLPISSGCTIPSGNDRVSLTYDALGRPKATNFTDPNTPDIWRDYDTNGNLEKVYRGTNPATEAAEVKWNYHYDSYNRIKEEHLTIDNRAYDLNYYYNAFGHMIRTTLPTGRNISYVNDGLGRHTRLKWGSTNYVSNGSYHPSGAVAGFTYADGQVFTQTLNSRLQPERLLAQDGAVKALDLTYGYDLNGRITSQTNGVDSNHSRSYSYDGAGRLKTATSNSFGTGSFTYDGVGNLRSKVMNGRTVTNSYDSNNRLTASNDDGTVRTVAYDNRGNITTLGNLAFLYDKADQPTVVSSGVNANYTYDGNMKRVKAVSNGKTIYNVYDFAGRLAHVDELDDATTTEFDPKETDYLHGMGQTIARIQNNSFTYLHPDHLGSAQSGTDRYGNVLWTEHYTPFGEALINNAANDNQGGFTSHIKDKDTGLNYMQARYYDPNIGRFLSIDPVTFLDTGSPSYFNRYRYCANDPVNCSDPTGMNDEGWIPDVFSKMFSEQISSTVNEFVAEGQQSVPGGGVTLDTNDAFMGDKIVAASGPILADATLEGVAQSSTMALGGPGVRTAAGAGTLTARAGQIHGALTTPIAQNMRTTAVAATKEGGRFVASSQNTLSKSQRAVLNAGETAVRGAGHAEVTAVRGAQAAGQTPVSVGASRKVCSNCSQFLKENGVKF